MHSFINNFFHQVSKDLEKFLANITDERTLYERTSRNTTSKISTKALAFVKNFFLGLLLTFEKGNQLQYLHSFQIKPCSSAMFAIHFDKPFDK